VNIDWQTSLGLPKTSKNLSITMASLPGVNPALLETGYEISIACAGKPNPAATLTNKGFLAQWQTVTGR
jgi:hypothetical protein